MWLVCLSQPLSMSMTLQFSLDLIALIQLSDDCMQQYIKYHSGLWKLVSPSLLPKPSVYTSLTNPTLLK